MREKVGKNLNGISIKKKKRKIKIFFKSKRNQSIVMEIDCNEFRLNKNIKNNRKNGSW